MHMHMHMHMYMGTVHAHVHVTCACTFTYMYMCACTCVYMHMCMYGMLEASPGRTRQRGTGRSAREPAGGRPAPHPFLRLQRVLQCCCIMYCAGTAVETLHLSYKLYDT